MSFADFLSHLGQIKTSLAALENIAAAVIPGASPVVQAIQAVQNPVIDTAASVAAAVTQTTGAPTPGQEPPAQAGDSGAPAGLYEVTDLSTNQTVLYAGTMEECEAWAAHNRPSGFSVRPKVSA